MSHTYSKLLVSDPTFNEIHRKLKSAGYNHAFSPDGHSADGVVIDMHGIGLGREPTAGQVDPLSRQWLKDMSDLLKNALPDNHGFILLAFPFGPGGRLVYSSTADRKDAIAAMKEFLIRNGSEEEWMKHL